MGYIILLVLALLLAVFSVPLTNLMIKLKTKGEPGLSPDDIGIAKVAKKVSWAAGLAAVAIALLTSVVTVPDKMVAGLNRVYFGEPMIAGQYIARDGQNGPQARILTPGFHFEFMVNVLYNVKEYGFTRIPEGYYGYIVAKDGLPLKKGQFLADQWRADVESKMLDGDFFLTNGGQKGPQLTVLKPGVYGINTDLFYVSAEPVTTIQAGFVGVVKSNVKTALAKGVSCSETSFMPEALKNLDYKGDNTLSVPLVPNGCVGVWMNPLKPNTYYLNRHAYEVTQISTRAETWEYKGGYERRDLSMTIDDEGLVKSHISKKDISVPEKAVGDAIKLRIQGWTIPQDLRVIVQVNPKDAPFVVASVGTLSDIRDKILTATIRSSARNVTGTENTKVLDLVEKRESIERSILESVKLGGAKAGVTIREVRLGDPAIPPELMVSRLREQLATQMVATFKNEKKAQDERKAKETAKSWADQQKEIVASAAQETIQRNRAKAAKQKGIGERDRLIEISKGMAKQVGVLGKSNVQQLAILDKVLEAAVKNPNIVKNPHILVNNGAGGSGSLEGAMAILGSSTLTNGLKVPASNTVK